MRGYLLSLAVMVIGAAATYRCGEVAIGQPCLFKWPTGDTGPLCQEFPTCSPLQDDSGTVNLNNAGCPKDCFLKTMECDNLMCIATAVENDSVHMNGQCDSTHQAGTDCAGAPFGCTGYCTKECISDASCPKGYRCGVLAPFDETLNCDPVDWDTNCTSTCADTGMGGCPASSDPDALATLCSQRAYKACCSCICHTFCGMTKKKVCRKFAWDQKLFPDATSQAVCPSVF